MDIKELDKKFLELATKLKWQRCPQCTIFVENTGGCVDATSATFVGRVGSLVIHARIMGMFSAICECSSDVVAMFGSGISSTVMFEQMSKWEEERNDEWDKWSNMY
ncbi:unnamed protein product [Sphenostylis stenocarpa]|uniref:Uncharacterized protein n=1 Tax=Sphenostylis stenocarpa TaxID=92480 RepID=A0AA86VJA6_9FABA|nr:unnamed protein product [Sphenostylis stenocarpa]